MPGNKSVFNLMCSKFHVSDSTDKDADRCLHLGKSHLTYDSTFLKCKSLKYKRSMYKELRMPPLHRLSSGTLLALANSTGTAGTVICLHVKYTDIAGKQPSKQPDSQAAATSITTTSNRANPKATTTVTVQTQLQDSTQLTSKQGDNIQLETSHIPHSCQGARPSCQPGSPPARLSACPCDLTVPPGFSHILLQHPQHLSPSWRLLHRLFVCNTVHSDSWQLPKNLP